MKASSWTGLILTLCLAGCTGGYLLVSPGTRLIDDLKVQADPGWNRVPATGIRWARSNAQVWTKDGMSLDRLVIIPHVPNGEAVYLAHKVSTVFPAFDAGMSGDDLQKLLESTIEIASGEGLTDISSNNLRPQMFGDSPGYVFDLVAVVHDGPNYRGVAGVFVADDHLYLLYFLGAIPYYFEQHRGSAEAVIRSATL
jgi:hypothetical protein